jgi:hypothetical protein
VEVGLLIYIWQLKLWLMVGLLPVLLVTLLLALLLKLYVIVKKKTFEFIRIELMESLFWQRKYKLEKRIRGGLLPKV